MVKLLMGWDIVPGKEGEHFDFFVQRFEPTVLEMGLKTNEVWYTAYGDLPQIVTGILADDLPSMQRALRSEQWRQLKAELLQLVTGYQQKIIPAREGYQL